MKRRKTWKWPCLFLAAVLLLSGCGAQARQRGIGGSYYEAENIAWEDSPGIIRYRNGYLYVYDENRNELRRQLSEESGHRLGEGPEEVVYRGTGGMLLQDFAVDDQGGIYCFFLKSGLTASFQSEITAGVLIKLGADGSTEFELPVEDFPRDWSGSKGSCLAMGGEGRLFLFSGNTIYVAEGEHGFISAVDVSADFPKGQAQRGQIWEGADDRVYCRVDAAGENVVYEVAKEGNFFCLKKMGGDEWEAGNAENGVLFGSSRGLLCNGSDGILRQYSPERGCWRDILNWSDSNVGGYLTEVVQIAEEEFLASFFLSSDRKTETYVLRGRPAEDAPKRQELVLACYGNAAQYLTEQVAAFNRTNDKYHLTIQIYQGEEGLARLDAELVSADAPDLLDLQWLDAEKYGKRKVMEDLTVYLDESPVLEKDDFLEKVTVAYTLEERLVCIPTTILLQTVLGRSSLFGETSGWDMEDAMSLTERYPDYTLFDRNGFAYNLDFFWGDYIAERFVDWENGVCSFDGEEFCCLMKWMAEHSAGKGYENRGGGQDTGEQMAVQAALSSAEEYARYLDEFDQDAVIVGYPSSDGRALHRVQVFDALGIPSRSRHKEGAWAFLEYFLSEPEGPGLYGFPSRRDLLEQMLEETVVFYSVFDQRPLSETEKEQILNAVSEADFSDVVRRGRKEKLLTIIREEMEGYLDGYKTMEEAAAVIQNRAGVFIQEER